MAKDHIDVDTLKCVHCGVCKAACPTHELNAVEPMSPRGRVMLVRSLLSGELSPSSRLADVLFSCLTCGMCEGTCPARVTVTECIYRGRAEIAKAGGGGRLFRAAAGLLLRNPALGYRTARLAGALITPFMKLMPFDLRPAARPLRDGPHIFKPDGKRKGRVAVFTGCMVNYLTPRLGVSLVNVLLGAGYEVVLPAGETCCGAPLRSLGLEDEARNAAQKNMQVFGMLKADAVLSLCPTCTLALKEHYPRLISEGLSNAMDVTEFINGRIDVRTPLDGEVVYHDPCHLKYGLGVVNEPREIIRGLGLGLLEPENPGCCGFGLAFTHKKMASALSAKRAVELGKATTVVTACPGCILQLKSVCGEARHIIEFVESATVAQHETESELVVHSS